MLLGRTLFIKAANADASGAAVISHRNYEMISCNSSSVLQYSVEITLINIKKNISAVFVNFSLVNQFDIDKILERIRSEHVDTVFIDNSFFGSIAKAIKLSFPNVYLISFFHNIEYHYFKELIRVSKRIHHYFTLALVKKAEKQITKYSDVLITLNKRDSDELKRLYKRTVELILPTSFKDRFDADQFHLLCNKSDVLSLLFVGSYFPPNVYAVDWFSKTVMPHISRDVKLYVVGNGFERHDLKVQDPRIKMIGRVDDLSKYYYQSDLVIAPIFHGSGMKTKVAEALMYNKPIAGTKEAFEGYNIDIDTIGHKCNDSKEFINYIENFQPLAVDVRNVFLENYSFETINVYFNSFLNANKK